MVRDSWGGRERKCWPPMNYPLLQGPATLEHEMDQYNGIVWAVENTTPSVLHAYDASNLHELYNSNQAGSRDQLGAGNKFITPTIVNGKVFVGTTNSVEVFGLLP